MFLVFVETYPAMPKRLNNFFVEESIYSFLKLLWREMYMCTVHGTYEKYPNVEVSTNNSENRVYEIL